MRRVLSGTRAPLSNCTHANQRRSFRWLKCTVEAGIYVCQTNTGDCLLGLVGVVIHGHLHVGVHVHVYVQAQLQAVASMSLRATSLAATGSA